MEDSPLASHSIDKTVTLTINGSRQQLRLCAARPGLPPLLIVQGGPALPLLHEVAKFQQRLNLETDFLVAYWEQRGCGNVPKQEADRVSMTRQVDDLRSVVQWLHDETGQRVRLLGISIGGSLVLQAVGHDATSHRVKSVVAVSPDSRTSDSDAAADVFLKDQASATNGRISRRVHALAPPPYLEPSSFQRRARLLADLRTIERKMTFNALVREFLVALLRTYGVAGTVRALRNLNVMLARLLPELAILDLLAHPPRVTVPVHYIYGEQDALMPTSVADALPIAIAAPKSTVRRVPDAGHMVHFDQPAIVRSVIAQA